MIKFSGVHEVKNAAGCTCFWIGGSVDQMADSGIDDRTRTHRAGFKGDHQCALVKTPTSYVEGGITKSKDFGVGGGIAGQFAFVVTGGNDVAVMNDNRTHRNIIMSEGGGSLVKGNLHPLLILIEPRSH
jgi:hypothetical protein